MSESFSSSAQTQPLEPEGGQSRATVWIVGCSSLAVFCLGAVLCAGAGAFFYQAYTATQTAEAVLVQVTSTVVPRPTSAGTPVPVVGATETPAGPVFPPTIIPAAAGTPSASSPVVDLLALTLDWDGGPLSPGQRTYHAQATPDQPVLISLGWCATTQEILDDNWTVMSYALTIDDAPMDLDAQFDLKPFTNSANIGPCYTYDGYTDGFSPGEHHIVWTQSIFQDLNDGQSDYAAGDYVMEFVLTVRP